MVVCDTMYHEFDDEEQQEPKGIEPEVRCATLMHAEEI